jgi:succinyl-diaminopimelate desuccinylase
MRMLRCKERPTMQATSAEIDEFIEQNWEAFLADAESLIRVDSSEDVPHAAPGAPFGPGPRAALDQALAIASRMGLATGDCDGYAGYAELSGESGQQLGVIGHVDVVPAGEGWTFDPFALTCKEGLLIGRGTTDDKAPVLTALYALKFWVDRGANLRHAVRFIFGCNEETGIGDVPHYLEKQPAPDFLFTPDADFPLCYGEKGQFGAVFTTAPIEGAVVSFEAGTTPNAVPGIARAVVAVPAESLPQTPRIQLEPCEGGTRIVATGIAGHASLPEGTVNAIGVLCRYLLGTGLCSAAEQEWFSFIAEMAKSTDGAYAGVACADKDFKNLTSVIGIMRKKNGRYMATDDIRFPTATTADALEAAFLKLGQRMGAQVEITAKRPPFVVNPETKTVAALMSAYCSVTGNKVEPFTMGGGTYAREFPNAVSFGPAEEGAFPVPEWVGGMHAANEGIAEEELKRAIAIYIQAFGNLAEVEDLKA